MSINLKPILTWIGKFFHKVKDDGAKIAVSITQGVKLFLQSGVADGLASVIDGIVGNSIAESVVSVLKANINKILAVELAIEGLPDNPTAQDILNFENAAITAVTGLNPYGKSKLYSLLASQIYSDVQEQLNGNTTLTFAQIVTIIGDAYNDYAADEAANAAVAA